MSEMEDNIEVREVLVYICDLCLDGVGGYCHTPGCAMFLNRAPNLPLRGNPFVAVFLSPGGAPVLDAALEETTGQVAWLWLSNGTMMGREEPEGRLRGD